MTKAHAGSSLGLSGDYILPVDFQDKLFPFYWNTDSGRQDYPTIDVSTMVPDDKFGQVVAVEDGTTNLIPSATRGFVKVAPTVNTEKRLFEEDSLLLNVTDNTTKQWSGPKWIGLPVTPGQTYTFSVWLMTDALATLDDAITVGAESYNSANVRTPIDKYITLTRQGVWTRYTNTFTVPADSATFNVYVYVVRNGKVYIACPQVENRGFVTSYVPGSRLAGSLAYPKEILNPKAFTIATWFKVNAITGNYQPILDVCSGTHQNNRLLIMLEANGVLRTWYGNATVNNSFTSNFIPEVGQWHHFVLTYDGTTYRMYVDGKLKSEATNEAVTFHADATFNIGGRYWGKLNGHFSNFLVSPRAAHAEEIEAWFEYGRPFYDPYDYTMIYE